MKQRWIVHIQAAVSSAVTSRQTAKRSAISVRHWVALSKCHRGRKCAQMPLKGGQEPLRMPQRFKTFHRPFAESGGLMSILGPVIEIPRPPVGHRRHQLTVSDL
jgi:hypothetical protein